MTNSWHSRFPKFWTGTLVAHSLRHHPHDLPFATPSALRIPAMSCRSALNLFRTSSSSYAARAAARPSLNAAHRRIAGARSYSAQAEPAEDNKQEGSSGSSSEASNAEKGCQEKLKKKEEEVQDLVVCLPASAGPFQFLMRCL